MEEDITRSFIEVIVRRRDLRIVEWIEERVEEEDEDEDNDLGYVNKM